MHFFACLDRICALCYRAQRDYLAQKLEEVDAQLREAKADRKESERDRRMSEAVDQLKRFFPGERCMQASLQHPSLSSSGMILPDACMAQHMAMSGLARLPDLFSAQPASRSPDMPSHAAQPPCMPRCARHKAQHRHLDQVRLQGVQH